MNITLQQMLTLDAVVSQGSIQAGARQLNKTHPSVITALKKLEDELGFPLFDRSGYRSVLTEEGKAFHKNVKRILGDIQKLDDHGAHLKGREEAELNVVVGDITPLPSVMHVLRQFAKKIPTRGLTCFLVTCPGPTNFCSMKRPI